MNEDVRAPIVPGRLFITRLGKFLSRQFKINVKVLIYFSMQEGIGLENNSIRLAVVILFKWSISNKCLIWKIPYEQKICNEGVWFVAINSA